MDEEPILPTQLAGDRRHDGLVDGHRPRWPVALGLLVAAAALLVAWAAWGLPALARQVASALPPALERRLGERVLERLDGRLLEPSALSEAEQAVVATALQAVAARGAPGQRFSLVFRASRRGDALNAFALPGGTVVVLDGLVRRTGGDDRLAAVVGHELAHLARRHSAGALVRGAGVTGLARLLWGGRSPSAVDLAAALAVLGYSGDEERQADDDALAFLAAAGRPPEAVVGLLCLFAEEGRGDGLLPAPASGLPNLDERLAHAREATGVEGCPAVEDEPDAGEAAPGDDEEDAAPQGDGEDAARDGWDRAEPPGEVDDEDEGDEEVPDDGLLLRPPRSTDI